MSHRIYTPEFKDEAVRQVLERGYTVKEVAERLGISEASLYSWRKAVRPSKDEERAEEANHQDSVLQVREDADFGPYPANQEELEVQAENADPEDHQAHSSPRVESWHTGASAL